MPTLEQKCHIDLTDLRRLEGFLGARLPDPLEQLRKVDADLDRLQTQIDEYTELAHQLEAVVAELALARETPTWQGETAAAANDFWEGVLNVLKYIAAIILFIVGILLLLLGAIMCAIGAICKVITDALEIITGITAGVAAVQAMIRTGVVSWALVYAAARGALSGSLFVAIGIVAALAWCVYIIGDYGGRAVLWLGEYLIEVGVRLTGDEEGAEKIRHERDKLFD